MISTMIKSTMLLVSFSLLLLLLPQLCQTLSLQQMCESRCLYGRGGNLCNCNAFHFAGKRSRKVSDPLLDLRFHERRKYEDADDVNGDMAASRSGPPAFPVIDDIKVDDHGNVVVGGFFGVEGARESAVHRLASLLKATVDDRLINGFRSPRKWRQHSLPYEADGGDY